MDAPAENAEVFDGFDEERYDPRLDQARFRAVVVPANCPSPDRIDLQFASKGGVQANGESSGQWYLLKYPKLVWKYDCVKSDEHVIDVFSGSDWAAF